MKKINWGQILMTFAVICLLIIAMMFYVKIVT